MASLANVTREAVLGAIKLCDAMGKPAFLDHHGYREAVTYHLRHDGRSYPSKAILGVAAGLKPADFFGGMAVVVKRLAALGFTVRVGEEVVSDAGFERLRRECVEAGFDDPAPAWPDLPVTPTAYFASGSNQPAVVRGLARCGADVGVAADYVSANTEAELVKLAGTDVLVFCDSGAFSEVEFGPEGVSVVKPIDHEAWLERLALYKRLATALGDQLFAVAPDRVGSQEVTLERLARYRSEVGDLRALGARVLVAVQKGALSQADFAKKVDEVLGFSDWVPALPCKKAATTAAGVAAFVAERKPAHVHLLGLGVRNKDAADYFAPFAGTEASVSCDSNWVTANVGRQRGTKPRRYTWAQDVAKKVMEKAGQLVKGSMKFLEVALTLCLGAPVPTLVLDGQQLSMFAA